jgi:AcrR family transcriptional regulator
LILFHFENKEKLYAKVQEILSAEYAAALHRFYKPDIPFSEMARETVRASYRHTRFNDDFRRISLWSYLEGQGHNRETEKKFTENMIAVVRQAQEAGLMRADLPADVLPFIVKGAIEYWIQKEELLDDLTGQETEAEREERLVNTLTRLLIP